MKNRTAFVVLGFPKCGTSALMDRLEALPGIAVARLNGQLEAPMYLNEENFDRSAAERAGQPGLCNGHKFAAYIYSATAIRRIVEHNDKVQLIVCVRDPMRALLSWRQMHHNIALSQRLPGHFVHSSEESRRFFADATLEDYYRQWVGNRLRYAEHLRRLQSVRGESTLTVVDQSCLAREPQRVIGAILDQLGLPPLPVIDSPSTPHVAKADQASMPPEGSTLWADMSRERAALTAALDTLVRRPRTVVLR